MTQAQITKAQKLAHEWKPGTVRVPATGNGWQKGIWLLSLASTAPDALNAQQCLFLAHRDILHLSRRPAFGGMMCNRPALWINRYFGVLRFRLMVKRGPCERPQASEGEASMAIISLDWQCVVPRRPASALWTYG